MQLIDNKRIPPPICAERPFASRGGKKDTINGGLTGYSNAKGGAWFV